MRRPLRDQARFWRSSWWCRPGARPRAASSLSSQNSLLLCRSRSATMPSRLDFWMPVTAVTAPPSKMGLDPAQGVRLAPVAAGVDLDEPARTAMASSVSASGRSAQYVLGPRRRPRRGDEHGDHERDHNRGGQHEAVAAGPHAQPETPARRSRPGRSPAVRAGRPAAPRRRRRAPRPRQQHHLDEAGALGAARLSRRQHGTLVGRDRPAARSANSPSPTMASAATSRPARGGSRGRDWPR